MYFSPKDTDLECNSLIYTFDNRAHQIYQIIKIDEENNEYLHCKKYGKIKPKFQETPTLNWSKIGVYEVGGLADEIEIIPKSNIAGKVIKLSSLFLTCPKNVINEK